MSSAKKSDNAFLSSNSESYIFLYGEFFSKYIVFLLLLLLLKLLFNSNYVTFKAYLWGTLISNVEATFDFCGFIINKIPNQSFESSVDLQTGHILPVVNALHFLHATSLTNAY